MKLIVVGATGFVGTEVIRQTLRNKAITSVVALARKPVPIPGNAGPEADVSKLKSVLLEDWTKPYHDDVKEQLKGADACLWLLAITPTKSKEFDFVVVTEVCYDYTVNGLENLAAIAKKPFRFLYTSGLGAERDQSVTPIWMPEYLLMRGRCENAVLEYAEKHQDVEVIVAKPGGVSGPGRPILPAVIDLIKPTGHDPYIHVSDLAAALIDQCVNGFTKDPLWPEDMTAIGVRNLRKEDYVDVTGSEQIS